MAASVLGSCCQAIRRYLPMALVAVMAFTAACSTKVGTNTTSSPSAVITPVGTKATSGAGTGAVAITVRSGAGVTLSGKDSDGNGAALASFSWKQTGGPTLQSAPIGGTLLYLTASTVEFTAPQVASNTVLTFQLTVTNALSVSATATATVTVTPANDPDELLVPSVVDNPSPPRRFVVAVAPPSASLTPAAPVCVSVNRSVTYTDRNKQQNTVSLPPLPALQANAVWNTAVTAVGASGSQAQLMAALQSTTNPRVAFDVPAFNDIELATMFNQALDSNGNPIAIPAASVNQQLVSSDLDSVVLNLAISATPGACTGTAPDPATVSGTALALGVFAPGAATPVVAPGATTPLTNGGSGPLQLTADALLQAVNAPALTTPATPPTVETLSGAQAYYNAIDPPWQGAPKTDLNTWLDANCFDHTKSDFGTGAAGANGAHAVYTNNFDLGFGRDMYFIKCAANHTDLNGNVTAYAGDMAAVVINYGSLEQVALKQATILAVAMEFQGPGHTNGNCGTPSGTCFAKFYVFAPNDRDGSYQRISSANFDRRGEKYVPGACLSCHGGSISDATYSTSHSENVDATFMPWDVDALLYSDTDPAFTGNLISGTPYTRAAQEPNLLRLNALAWQTYQTPEFLPLTGGGCTTPPAASATCVDRFAAPIALLTKWYGWCGPTGTSCPTAHPYTDDSSTAANDWPIATPQGAPTTPAGAPNDLYHAVYAHQCRSCHTQNNVIKKQFNDFATFSSYLKPVTGASLQQLVFSKAQMPLARLTTDRFWVDYNGGSTSAAQTLATYINSQAGVAPVNVAADNSVVPPGAPVVNSVVFSNVNANGIPQMALPVGGLYPVARFNGSRSDFSSSVFASTYESTLCLQQTTNPADGTPCMDQPFVGSSNAVPAFDTSAWGIYNLKMTGTSSDGLTSSSTLLIQAKQSLPNIASCNPPSTLSLGLSAMTTVVNLSGCNGLGDTPLLQVLDPTNGGSYFPASGSTNLNYTINGPTYTANLVGCTIAGAAVSGCTISFGFLPSALNSVTLSYQLLDQFDNVSSQAQTVISVARDYSAIQVAPFPMILAQNLGNPLLQKTLCIPLSNSVAVDTNVAPCVPLGGTAALLDGEVSPPADQFKFTFLGNPSPGGTLVPAPGIALDTNLKAGNAISYTTPASGFSSLGGSLVTCDVLHKDILTSTTPCSGVTIQYALQSDTLSGTVNCSTNPVPAGFICNSFEVVVNATTSFISASTPPAGLSGNSVYSILQSNCESCHVPPTSACPNAIDAGCKWNVVASTPAQTPGDQAATLATLNAAACFFAGTPNVPCLTKGNPSQSQAFLNACGTDNSKRDTVNHGTSPLITDAAQCATLSQWIGEGANLH
jgi:hypothetical protein